MLRRFALLLALGAAILAAPVATPSPTNGGTVEDLTVTVDDGTRFAVTLQLPMGNAPPGGWPGIVMVHGIGGTRAKENELAAEWYVPHGYAVLSYDARGHGASGGLFDADGPRMIADFRFFVEWLGARPDVNRSKLGAWSISLGGGAVWRSLVDGLDLAAAVPVITWTDLYRAFVPQGLSKSGVVYSFLNAVRPDRLDPSVVAIRDDALNSRNLPRLREFGRVRSSSHALRTVKTPVLVVHGRRDFPFSLDEGITAFRGVAGPKRLYIGPSGHAPSKFPGPDLSPLMEETRIWFDRFLKGRANGIDRRPPVKLVSENGKKHVELRAVPATRVVAVALRGRGTIGGGRRVVGTATRSTPFLETFGAPVARVRVSSRTGFPHLVAVLTATTPAGKEIVVSQGGAKTTLAPKPKTVTIRLISQATVIPRGSRLRLVLADTSTAHHPGNLLYITPAPQGNRATIHSVSLTLPVLRTPISR